MKPLIVEVGLNEAAQKAQNPNVAYSPEEIAADAVACAEAGASIIHFHARDPQTGANRMSDTDLYSQALQMVNAAGCDVLMYPTYDPAETDVNARFGHVFSLVDAGQLDLGVLDMGSFNLILWRDGGFVEGPFLSPEASVFQNPYSSLDFMLRYYSEHGLIPNLAVYEPGHLRTVLSFMRAKVITCTPIVKFFFSDQVQHGLLPDHQGVDAYVHMIERAGTNPVEWMVVCHAMNDKAAADDVLAYAIRSGGHARVGIGDMPVASQGRSNAELVREVVDVGLAAGRRPATPAEVLRLKSSALPELAP